MKIRVGALSKNGFILAGILIIAVAMRLYGITFGLPGIYDPDEPFFTMTGLKLLSGHSLNPGWFGHPGTTTLYVLAIIDALSYVFGHLSGAYPNPKAFGVTIFTNPAVVVLPARLFIALCGVACVGLIYGIGRRMYGARIGLLAAALLAVNSLHIQWSQIIRTDVQATVFMLLCVLASIGIVRNGRLKDYLIAAAWVGLAAATKWPAASIIVCPMGAAILRARDNPVPAPQIVRHIGIIALASVCSLLIVSPYLILDYQTALANIQGEASPMHLGATGGSFLFNLSWYLAGPIAGSIGWLGLALACVGMVAGVVRNRLAVWVLMPGAALFFLIICVQSLIWTRWVVPLLPFISLFTALGIVALGDLIRGRRGGKSAVAVQLILCCLIMIPMVLTWRSQAVERLNDTRGLATAWIRQNLPEKSSIAIEYFAFDLLRGQRRVYYPAGAVGCVYANDVLRGGVRYKQTNKWRAGRSILDLGTVENTQLDSCRAQYAMFTDYDRYQAEAARYPREIATYDALAKGGTLLKLFSPVPGEVGGPIVRVYKLARPAV